MLRAALELGITPFLDLILTSPRGALEDLAETVREAYRWLRRAARSACIPTSFRFPARRSRATRRCARIRATRISGSPAPASNGTRPRRSCRSTLTRATAILRIESDFESTLAALQRQVAHLPSRVRSLVWLHCALPTMAEYGYPIADSDELSKHLLARAASPASTRTALSAVANA